MPYAWKTTLRLDDQTGISSFCSVWKYKLTYKLNEVTRGRLDSPIFLYYKPETLRRSEQLMLVEYEEHELNGKMEWLVSPSGPQVRLDAYWRNKLGKKVSKYDMVWLKDLKPHYYIKDWALLAKWVKPVAIWQYEQYQAAYQECMEKTPDERIIFPPDRKDWRIGCKYMKDVWKYLQPAFPEHITLQF